jgi:hypothetical protein
VQETPRALKGIPMRVGSDVDTARADGPESNTARVE